MSHLAEREAKSRMEVVTKTALRPCQDPVAWTGFSLYVPWNEKEDFSSFFSPSHIPNHLSAPGSASAHIQG